MTYFRIIVLGPRLFHDPHTQQILNGDDTIEEQLLDLPQIRLADSYNSSQIASLRLSKSLVDRSSLPVRSAIKPYFERMDSMNVRNVFRVNADASTAADTVGSGVDFSLLPLDCSFEMSYSSWVKCTLTSSVSWTFMSFMSFFRDSTSASSCWFCCRYSFCFASNDSTSSLDDCSFASVSFTVSRSRIYDSLLLQSSTSSCAASARHLSFSDSSARAAAAASCSSSSLCLSASHSFWSICFASCNVTTLPSNPAACSLNVAMHRLNRNPLSFLLQLFNRCRFLC